MKQRMTQVLISLSIAAALLLSGCAMQTRSSNDLPASMHTVYITSVNPNDQLTVQLTRQLQALNIDVVDSPKEAPVTLRITKNIFSAELPTLVASSTTFSYSYTLDTAFELTTQSDKIILTRSLSASDSLIQNSQQMYTPTATALMQRELTHTMVTLIYEQLTTRDAVHRVNWAVKEELPHAPKQTAIAKASKTETTTKKTSTAKTNTTTTQTAQRS